MALINTAALVLKNVPFQETSSIVRFFTRSQGKISVIAKGARRLKSAFRGYLEPLNLVELIYYYKPTREIQTLSKIELIQALFRNVSEFTDSMYAMAVIECIDKFVIDHHRDEAVFDHAVEVLRCMDGQPGHLHAPLLYFLSGMTQLLGYGLSLEKCGICNRPLRKAIYNSASGQLLCEDCGHYAEHFQTLGVEDTETLRKLNRMQTISDLSTLTIDEHDFKIVRFLVYYIAQHLEIRSKVKSIEMLMNMRSVDGDQE